LKPKNSINNLQKALSQKWEDLWGLDECCYWHWSQTNSKIKMKSSMILIKFSELQFSKIFLSSHEIWENKKKIEKIKLSTFYISSHQKNLDILVILFCLWIFAILFFFMKDGRAKIEALYNKFIQKAEIFLINLELF